MPVLGYLDDLLLIEQSASLLGHNISLTVHTLERFGWVFSLQKSALIPAQRLEYLGLLLDLSQARVFFPSAKVYYLGGIR